MNVWKILQRQCYDILSNKCYLILCIILTYTSVISLFHFCEEVWLNFTLKNKLNVRLFADNIGGRVIEDQLCQYLPIDVVYTWVNGSDPVFISQLKSQEIKLRKELSQLCPLTDCLPSHFTAFRQNISELYTVLNELSYLSIISVKTANINWTLLRWDSVQTAEEQADKIFNVNEENISPFHVHWTTEEEAPSLHRLGSAIAIKGLNKSVESLSRNVLEQCIGKSIASVWRYRHIIYAELSSESDVNQVLKGKKWNIVFKKNIIKLNITRAGLVLEIPSHLKADDHAASRYEDKEELRYSLRSLEKYAPWVRRVYIVTNGQLPHWLDLSNPRVQIITHDSLFTNSSHLPTFSSPAIETHLHRIPGLSDKFLYFNDDIFLGEEVLPEDFITTKGEQKVYLSWPVPDCSAVCPWTWVGDGTCDLPCNTSACDFDGGDCLSLTSVNPHLHISNEDYADYAEEPVNSGVFMAKQNRTGTVHLSGRHDDKSISLKNTSQDFYSKNISYLINSDNDLNDLLNFLTLNKTRLTSNVVQDMFVLLKILQVNNTKQSSADNKSELFIDNLVRNRNLTLVEKNILLKKLTKSYRYLFNGDFIKKDELEHSTRNILSVPSNRISEQQQKNSITPRVISPINLTRSQVGLPPLGEAERFYAELTTPKRKLDTFAESLLFVNSLLNKKYGYKARKVPAHMPHLIDKNIMSSLQNTFPKEYENTSAHYFRHPEDMQFSFGYFYYLMNEESDVPISKLFNMFDTDDSGTWSDREIRTVLTRLYDLPLQRSSVLNFETSLIYCAKHHEHNQQLTTPPFERYIDSNLQQDQPLFEFFYFDPLVTKQLIENCSLITDLLKRKMGKEKKFLFTSVKPTTREAVIGFHMITSNLSYLLTTLDKIRRKPKKFICLNDNMDATRSKDNQLIRAVLIDFFHSLFPKPSQFELPPDYRNRYLYHSEFVYWRTKKQTLSTLLYTVLGITVIFIFCCLFQNECRRLKTKLKRRLQRLFADHKSGRRKMLVKL